MSDNPTDFRKTHFRTPEAPDSDWYATFREFARQTMHVEIDRTAPSPLYLESTMRALPGVLVIEAASSPMRVRNMPAPDASNDVILILDLDGDAIWQGEGKTIRLGRDVATAVAGNRPATIEYATPVTAGNLRIARRLLEPLVPNLSEALARPIATDTPEMRLLYAYLQCLRRETSIPSPETQRIVVSHIVDLAALVLGASQEAQTAAQSRGVQAARLAAVKNDIFAHLEEPDLSIKEIAARQGVTARYIQTLFRSEGTTFTRFVLGERLARAHRMLNDPRMADRPVNAIAFGVGFGDLSYFNRMFRRMFGKTPSDVRNPAERRTD